MSTGRPPITPAIQAIITVLESITLGATPILVGWAGAPECEPGDLRYPYLILTTARSTHTGSIQFPEADATIRFTVVAVGQDPHQASLASDLVRTALTRDAVDTALANRRVMYLWMDIHRAEIREERGLPDPLFSTLDQYVMETTPG